MNIPASINAPMNPAIGMMQKTLPPQLNKLGQNPASFDSIYKLGLNSLKASVSEPVNFFGMGKLIKDVDGAAKEAARIRADALSGGPSTLHQAMIASQEAKVSFTLLVEMRNKLLETYQELMRMQI
jgi:flagellar hook-basal body complex protein FliE